jgi:hypothetical protein
VGAVERFLESALPTCVVHDACSREQGSLALDSVDGLTEGGASRLLALIEQRD